jgi:hypothetical protein
LTGHALAVTGLLAVAVTLPLAAGTRRVGMKALPIAALLLLLGLGVFVTGLRGLDPAPCPMKNHVRISSTLIDTDRICQTDDL